MDRNKLYKFKQKSKDSVGYMKCIEKEYLKKSTLTSKIEFVDELHRNHSREELEYLYNDMISEIEGDKFFSGAYPSIILPIVAMITTVFGGFFAAMSGFLNQYGMKMADIYTKNVSNNKQSIEHFMYGMGKVYTGVYSKITDILTVSIFIILILLLAFLLYYSMKLRRRRIYISYIKSALSLFK